MAGSWCRADIKKDKFFLKLVNLGKLQVFKSGVVINPATGRRLGSKALAKAGGYHRVSYVYKGIKRGIYLHRLIWLAFKGLIPKGLQINHKNGNKSNNRLSNLELATNSQNVKHSYERLGHTRMRGQLHGLAKFTPKDIRRIRRLKGKIPQRQVAKEYGVTQQRIHAIMNNRAYKNVA